MSEQSLLHIRATLILADLRCTAKEIKAFKLNDENCLKLIDFYYGKTRKWPFRKVKNKAKKKDEKWVETRNLALDKYGYRCMKCGSDKATNVDHIKPKSLYPALIYDINNLQILCWPCNKAKSNKNEIDYRRPQISIRF